MELKEENHMYEQLLDEVTRVSWTSSPEEGERLRSQRDQLICQFTQSAAETLPILLKALQESDLFRQTTVIEIIDVMGYPANEPAIPALLSQIEEHDPNSPVWRASVQALSHLGPDIVMPYLIPAFLEKGMPARHALSGDMYTSWNEAIEGLSMMLCKTTLGNEWASQC